MERTTDRTAERNSERSYTPLLMLAVILVMLLPLLYVLAIGPLVWLHSTERITIAPNSTIARIYSPLDAFCDYCEPAGRIIRAYVELWRVDNASLPPPATTISPPAAAPTNAPSVPQSSATESIEE